MTFRRAKNLGNRFAASAALTNPIARRRNSRDEDNRAVTIPRGTSVCRVRDALQRAAAEIHRFDFAVGVKPDTLAVGGPEWSEGAFRTVDASRGDLGQPPDPQGGVPIRIDRNECHASAVRRDRKSTRLNSSHL